MNEQQRTERRLKSIEEKLDKISEAVILLCKIEIETNPSDIARQNQLLTLKRLAERLARR